MPVLKSSSLYSPATAIIPAFNEAGRVGQVVEIACQSPELSEIIVVDDGSNDGTGAAALAAGGGDARLRVLHHSRNLGKGQGLFTGWRAAQTPYLLFLDADLINLTPQHIHNLLAPVLDGTADMTLGQFQHGYWRTDITQWLTPWLSGQRSLRAELMEFLSEEAAAGYGFETAITLVARQQHWRCRRVALAGVSHVPGDVPRGSWRGPATKLRMWRHVLRAWWMLPRGQTPPAARRAVKPAPMNKISH